MSENKDKVEATGSTHFVFVHGASHGGWCWYKVQTMLENVGHKVDSIDLKSAGIDLTSPDTLFKFDEYNQPLLDLISSLPSLRKVILVGHSLGGLNVTHALNKFPTKIRAIVYLAAAMSKQSTPTLTSFKLIQPQSQITDTHNKQHLENVQLSSEPPLDLFEWTYGLGPDGPPTSIIMKKEFQRHYYYSMSPLEDYTLAGLLVRPCPFIATSDYKLSEDNEAEMEKVPRVFIKTLQDNMMTQESQDELIKNWPPAQVFTIDSDHSAFFSKPSDLFNMLLEIASTYV